MAYNMSFMDTSNNLFDITNNVNNLTNGLLSMAFIVGVFLFVFSKSLERGTSAAFMIASFTATVFGSLFMFAGLIEWWFLTVLGVLFLISVGIKFFGD